MRGNPGCVLCKLHKTTENVCSLGHGPQRSDVMVIRDAPGTSTRSIDKLLDEHDIEDVFYAHTVSCKPPEDKKPGKREIAACKKWLDYQIAQVKPKFVLLVGNTPLIAITGESGINKKRGTPFEKDGIIYLPTFSHDYLLRKPEKQYVVEKDLRLFKEIIDGGKIPREEGLNFTIVRDAATFRRMLADLRGVVSIDTEATCLYPWQTHNDKGEIWPAKITSLGFGTSDNQWILPISATAWKVPFSPEVIETMIEQIEETLRKNEVKLVAHNGKFDFLWLWVHFKVQWYDLFSFDSMLAHYILDENSFHGLDILARKYLGAHEYDVPLELKWAVKGTLEDHALYLAHDLYYTRQLRFILGRKLRQDRAVKRVFDEIMMPCARLFVEVEYDGVCINMSKFADAEKYLRKEAARAEAEMMSAIREATGTDKWKDINWGSPKQVGELLFGIKRTGGLGIAVVERTAKGAASTSESVLKRIDHPIAGELIKFRGAKQQLSFFIEGWKPFLHQIKSSTGVVHWFLHPSFKLHGTVTGRLSCEHPNLQQVPRDERIRSLITAPDGWTLVECDLSQIELRVAAELAQERHMLAAFRSGQDIHWMTCLRELERGGGKKEMVLKTAQSWSKKKDIRYGDAIELLLEMGAGAAEAIDKGWKELRKKAKAVNFGYLYGMWWKKFKIYARDNYDVILTDEDAEESRVFFFDLWSDLPRWHKRQREFARRNGYVRTLSGRKRRLPAALSMEDTPERREAERQAINSPVQSFANEINLMAAIQLRREFTRNTVRICGTVHDAILMWVKNDHVEQVTSRLLEIMTRPELFDLFEIELGVPVLAESKIGAWSQGISLEKWKERHGNERSASKVRLLRKGSTRRANVHIPRTRSSSAVRDHKVGKRAG